MNILFYIEQFPIRETFTQHTWLINKILNMIANEYYNKKQHNPDATIKVLMNSFQFESADSSLTSNLYNFILKTNEEEKKYVETCKKKWNEAALQEWKDLMNGYGSFSNFTESILERIYNEIYQFNVIVYWGTNGAIKNFSNTYNIPAIAMELGCTRSPFPKTIYFDYRGVNGNAYTQKLNVDKLEKLISFKSIKHALHLTLDSDENWEGIHKFVNSTYSAELYKEPEKNILIPLQMTDDANIINFTKYSSMFDFISEIIPILTSRGYRCFVKPHPLALKPNTLTLIKEDYRKCYEYVQTSSQSFWVDDINNQVDYLAFLNLFNAVCVINSSIGFECLLLKKIIIPFGASPYNISDVLPNIDNFINQEIDMINYINGIEKVANALLFYYLKRESSAFEYNNFISTIKFNILLSKHDNDSITEIVSYNNEHINYYKKSIKDSITLLNNQTENTNPILFVKKINKFVFRLYQKYNINKKIQWLKKIPVLSKILLLFKNKILKWKIEN